MILVFILSIIPVILWALMEPLGFRFSDWGATTTSIGQLFGLVGMTLFSINLILAGRFKFLDKYFGGLDKVYKYHSKIGSLAFSFILFHPIFLVVKLLSISITEASLFFVPFLNMPITWGIISLFLMIILICLTFYVKLKYNVWKMSHKFMTVAFFFGILHTLTISSDVSRNGLLNWYILTLAFIGLGVSIHQAFLSKFLAKKFKYKVKSVNMLNGDIVEVEMEPQNDKMTFKAGQFAFFVFKDKWVSSESHPFSISSGSKENGLKITVKNLGDYTSVLKNLEINDEVVIDGPYGNFSYDTVPSKSQIWIAGGIGITPFLSMAKSIDKDYSVDLYYSVKEDKEAIYLKSLQELSQKISTFKFNLWVSKDKGYLNGDSILSMSNGLDSKDIFLCGPLTFMESLKKQFLSLGVNSNKIHYENFSLFD